MKKKLSRKIFTAIDLEIWSWKVLTAKKCGDIAKEYIQRYKSGNIVQKYFCVSGIEEFGRVFLSAIDLKI